MRARAWFSGLAVAALATAGSVAAVRHAWALHLSPPVTTDTLAPSFGPGSPAIAERDNQIRVWRQALAADTGSAVVKGQLAAYFAQRAREGGTFQDYLDAERLARQSLGRRTNRNGATAATLVSVLLAQHRFGDAYEEASALVEREPDIPQYRAILGEVAMELGRYDVARQMFATAWPSRTHLSVAPRLARWLELTGHVDAARRLLIEARDAAWSRRDVAQESKGWFALRVGDLELRAGRPRASLAALHEGLAAVPGDHRLQSAMARLAAAEGDSANAIAWGERAIASQLDPATLGLVADAYATLGDAVRSHEFARTLQVIATAQAGPPHRAWSLFQLDHGLHLTDVLRGAERELDQRQDVYGYDLVAWAFYRNGRFPEAASMMRHALALGTVDPLLQRHAAAIDSALTRSQTRDVASLSRLHLADR